MKTKKYIILELDIWDNENTERIQLTHPNKGLSGKMAVKRYVKFIQAQFPNMNVYVKYTDNPNGYIDPDSEYEKKQARKLKNQNQ